MTATKNGTPPLDELAIVQAANRLRAEYVAAVVRKATANIKAWVKRHITDPARARVERNRQLEELTQMDDHMLRDLGLSRGGIAYAFEHGREVAPANANEPATKTPRAA